MMRLADHALTLERELAWVAEMIDTAFRLYFGQDCRHAHIDHVTPPDIAAPQPPAQSTTAPLHYAAAVHAHQLTPAQRLVLMLALIPHVRPQLLDPFLMKNENFGRVFTEFGGTTRDGRPGFWPTVETASFILAGSSMDRRLQLHALFHLDGPLLRHHLVELEPAGEGAGLFGSALRIGPRQLHALTTGADWQPDCGGAFPARRLHTSLAWDDLVLDDAVRHDVDEIRAWIEHGATLLGEWELGRRIKPGFRSLFYGPPGTGKTLTAALLGKCTGREVYRVDLSLVVSKYIGETEKNLSSLFDHAERGEGILFFDEADALFGKRTQTASANDRYANQEVGYLLQRIEDCPGVVILATNLRSNIDEAFARRFQSMILFPLPRPAQRLELWRRAFAQPERLGPDVDLVRIADEYELAGGAIVNVLRYAALMSLRRGTRQIGADDIRHGIRRELWKEGQVA